jgi:hypothetical protein
MIRQLTYRCWSLDPDPGNQSHHTIEAAAIVEQAELAQAEGGSPRPVRHHAVACWVAGCDRCQAPAGDHDECGLPAHHPSKGQLLATLTTTEWLLRQEDRRVSCPDCAAASPPPAAGITRVGVSIDWAGSRRVVPGEVTACSDLVIMPGRSDQPGAQEVWLGLRLVHRPTGRYIPLPASFGAPISVLHRIAELPVGLDWSSPQVEDYATGYATTVGIAYHQACQEHFTLRDLARWDPMGGGER